MIPRYIHQIWFGPGPPEHLVEPIRSWQLMNPGWEYVLWTEADLPPLRDAHRAIFDEAPHRVPADAVMQLRADVARYAILERHGGFYADADTICHKPIQDALDGHDAFAAAEDLHWVGNTYLACTPYHPVMQAIQDELPASVYARRGGRRPNYLTGPRFITPIWKRHGCHVDPPRRWFPYSYTHVRRGELPVFARDGVYAEHLWNHTRERMEARR